MAIRNHIPNLITVSNLLLGVLSIVSSSRGELTWAAGFIYLATIPDFLDGMMARLLKVTSAVGKDLDSLADLVSFGVAPAVLFFELEIYAGYKWLPYVVLIVPLFAAVRLAKFNNDNRQSDEFYGLPTPSVALFMASWPFLYEYSGLGMDRFLVHPVVLVMVPILLSGLMVSELRLFSLKFKSFKLAENYWRYGLILAAIVLMFFLHFAAIPVVILLYIILSIIHNFAR